MLTFPRPSKDVSPPPLSLSGVELNLLFVERLSSWFLVSTISSWPKKNEFSGTLVSMTYGGRVTEGDGDGEGVGDGDGHSIYLRTLINQTQGLSADVIGRTTLKESVNHPLTVS